MSLRVGLVGLEPFTHWSHYFGAAETSAAVELVAVCHRPELTEAMSADQVALLTALKLPTYHNLAEMLANERLDVLAASTVPDVQGAALIAGLEHGLHVVADKPLVSQPEQLEQVKAALKRHPGQRLSMLLTLRGDPVRRAARRLVQEGAIGRVVALHSRRAYVQKRQPPRPAWMFDERQIGGPTGYAAVHSLDEVYWITGLRYQEVVGYEANHSQPENRHFYDVSQHLYRLEHGVTAIIDTHLLAINDCWLSILGTEGKIEIAANNRGVLITADGTTEIETTEPEISVFADWIESIEAGRPALVDTEDVLVCMDAVFAGQAASKSGRPVAIAS